MHPHLKLQIHCDRAHEALAAARTELDGIEDVIAIWGTAATEAAARALANVRESLEIIQQLKPVPTVLAQPEETKRC